MADKRPKMRICEKLKKREAVVFHTFGGDNFDGVEYSAYPYKIKK